MVFQAALGILLIGWLSFTAWWFLIALGIEMNKFWECICACSGPLTALVFCGLGATAGHYWPWLNYMMSQDANTNGTAAAVDFAVAILLCTALIGGQFGFGMLLDKHFHKLPGVVLDVDSSPKEESHAPPTPVAIVVPGPSLPVHIVPPDEVHILPEEPEYYPLPDDVRSL